MSNPSIFYKSPELLFPLIKKWFSRQKVPFLSSIIFGLASYMFVITNKLVNYDELFYTFGKGEELSSGRWGLSLLSFVIPDYSMPWLWGLLSIIVLAFVTCIIVDIFDIKSKVIQVTLSGAIVTNVAIASNMLLLYVCACYAFSFLFSTSAVLLIKNGSLKSIILAFVLSVFSISIYQPYISVLCSLMLILLIQKMISSDINCISVIKQGLLYVLFIVASTVTYYLLTLALQKYFGQSFNGYASSGATGALNFFDNLLFAYKSFADIFAHHFVALIGTDISQIANTILFILSFFLGFVIILKDKNYGKIIIYCISCIIFFPISVNMIFLAAGTHVSHALMMCGACSIFVFDAVMTDAYFPWNPKVPYSEIAAVCLLITSISNMFIANKSFMKQYMDYENIYSFFTISMAEVSSTPGYDENSKVAFVGWYNMPEYVDNFGDMVLYGSQEMGNAYSKNLFIRYYIGLDIPLADLDECNALQFNEEYQAMPRYPYNGYVKKIGNYIVVKL